MMAHDAISQIVTLVNLQPLKSDSPSVREAKVAEQTSDGANVSSWRPGAPQKQCHVMSVEALEPSIRAVVGRLQCGYDDFVEQCFDFMHIEELDLEAVMYMAVAVVLHEEMKMQEQEQNFASYNKILSVLNKRLETAINQSSQGKNVASPHFRTPFLRFCYEVCLFYCSPVFGGFGDSSVIRTLWNWSLRNIEADVCGALDQGVNQVSENPKKRAKKEATDQSDKRAISTECSITSAAVLDLIFRLFAESKQDGSALYSDKELVQLGEDVLKVFPALMYHPLEHFRAECSAKVLASTLETLSVAKVASGEVSAQYNSACREICKFSLNVMQGSFPTTYHGKFHDTRIPQEARHWLGEEGYSVVVELRHHLLPFFEGKELLEKLHDGLMSQDDLTVKRSLYLLQESVVAQSNEKVKELWELYFTLFGSCDENALHLVKDIWDRSPRLLEDKRLLAPEDPLLKHYRDTIFGSTPAENEECTHPVDGEPEAPVSWRWISLLLQRVIARSMPSVRRNLLLTMIDVSVECRRKLIAQVLHSQHASVVMNDLPMGFHLPTDFICGRFLGYIGDKAYYKGASGGLAANVRTFLALYYAVLSNAARRSFLLEFVSAFPGKTKNAKVPFRMCAEVISDFHAIDVGSTPGFLEEGYGTTPLSLSPTEKMKCLAAKEDDSEERMFKSSCFLCKDISSISSVFDSNLQELYVFSEASSDSQTRLMFSRCLITYMLLVTRYVNPNNVSVRDICHLLSRFPRSFADWTESEETSPLSLARDAVLGTYDRRMNFLCLVDWLRNKAKLELKDDDFKSLITKFLDGQCDTPVDGIVLLLNIYHDRLNRAEIMEPLYRSMEDSSSRLYKDASSQRQCLLFLHSLLGLAKASPFAMYWLTEKQPNESAVQFTKRLISKSIDTGSLEEDGRLAVDVTRRMVLLGGATLEDLGERLPVAVSTVLARAFAALDTEASNGSDSLNESAVYVISRLLFLTVIEENRQRVVRDIEGTQNDFVSLLERCHEHLLSRNSRFDTMFSYEEKNGFSMSFPVGWYALGAVHRVFHHIYGEEADAIRRFENCATKCLQVASNGLETLSAYLNSSRERKHEVLNYATSHVIPLVRCCAVAALNSSAEKLSENAQNASNSILVGMRTRSTWNERCWYDFVSCILSQSLVTSAVRNSNGNTDAVSRVSACVSAMNAALESLLTRAMKGGVSAAVQAVAHCLGTFLRQCLRSRMLTRSAKKSILLQWKPILLNLLLFREPLSQGELATLVDKNARLELLQRLYWRMRRHGADTVLSRRWVFLLQSYLQKCYSRPAACNHNGQDFGLVGESSGTTPEDVCLPWNVDAGLPDVSAEEYDDIQGSFNISQQVSISRVARIQSLFFLDDLISEFPSESDELLNSLFEDLIRYANDTADQKNSYLPGSEQHGKRLRALQAGLLLSKVVSGETALTMFPVVVKILLGVELASTRYCLEVIGANMCTRFPSVVTASAGECQSLVEVLKDINLKQMPSFSLVLVASRALIDLNGKCGKDRHDENQEDSSTKRIALENIREILFRTLFPWICGNTATVRCLAQLAVLHAEDTLEQLKSKHPLLDQLVSVIKGSSMVKTMVEKFESIVLRFSPVEESSLESILTNSVTEHGELVPPDTFSKLKAIHHTLLRMEPVSDQCLAVGTNRARADPKLEKVMDMTWLVHAGVDLGLHRSSELSALFSELTGSTREASNLHEDSRSNAAGEENYQRKIQPWEWTRLGLGARDTTNHTLYREANSTEDTSSSQWNSVSLPTASDTSKAEVCSMMNPISGRKHQPVIMCAALVDKTPNLGGLARTCEVFSAESLVVPNKSVIGERGFQDVSVSAAQWLPIHEVAPSHLREYLTLKKKEGYTIVGLEQTAKSQPMDVYSFPENVVLVMGKEKEGLPANILTEVDVCVEIPQLGIIRSLNVHVSGAMLLWEYTRQRLLRYQA
eukprot:gb/GECG01005023.1/.p1 GENE.gb/GECG01005023.1/~~gb/GECG01005023.1/.p1  ORF type:complete len:1947 (+),score=202.07 gb/GECG01005023.1/:1-5841(+)